MGGASAISPANLSAEECGAVQNAADKPAGYRRKTLRSAQDVTQQRVTVSHLQLFNF